jgi:endogenous inhibitor of DNA gyrase (YacG/DUF329 family)
LKYFYTFQYISRMKKLCLNCENAFIGRSDKRFCSPNCKNVHFNNLRKNTKDVTKEIDGYLHRNHQILATLMGESKKETLDRLQLTRAGFKYEYMTGIYINKEGKTYYIVYDYAWMAFSDQKVLVIRKSK